MKPAAIILLVFAAAAETADSPLSSLVKKSYLDLVELAPGLNLPRKSIDDYRKQIEVQRKEDVDGLDAEKKRLQAETTDLHRQLDEINASASHDDAAMARRRLDLHCKLMRDRIELSQSHTERAISVPVTY
ncbi:MAG: hypothetical protein KGN36_02450, partial [Acidobacteriota bacterium]|nr:hypothetical protein [Acidobacteriota bacterium]